MSLYILRIEIDGHWHGSGDVPKPWIARVDGPDDKYGLRREFVDRMNDWRDARKAWSGNRYGVVATWALREGHLYEISRARGNSSRRYMAREFRWCADGRLHARTEDQTLDHADGCTDPGIAVRLPDDREDPPWVSEVTGLGTPKRLAFIADDGDRIYRAREGRLYELRQGERRWFETVAAGRRVSLTQEEALSRLLRSA